MSAGKQILVVENEPAIAELLSDFLESEGYEIETARTTGEALDILRSRQIDLITLDLDLPGSQPWDFLGQAGPERSGVPVIGLTTRLEKHASAPPLSSVVPKPFDLDELHCAILRHLQQVPFSCD